MLCDLIKKISDAFISEAISSPALLADMAKMEKYMAESYSGRVFIELLQNADDCKSTKIFISELNGNIIFANNGRPFDENDVMAICRSGNSNKKRGETIGYRGVGFKSTTYLTDEILIYSDKACFTFSKKICSQKLSIPEENIPMIRVPLLVEAIDNSILAKLQELEQQGYKTIFVFKNAKIKEFIEELDQVDNGMFIFLNNVEECSIKMGTFSKSISLSRESSKGGCLVRFLEESNDAWYVVSHKNTSLGFKYDIINKRIVACNENEQVYHSYLPTYDKVLFPVKINADFTTDPSRKHITVDTKTEMALADIAENILLIVNSVFEDNNDVDFSEFFSILCSNSGFSKCNSYLKQQIKLHLLGIVLNLQNGKTIKIDEYKLLPDWLDESEKHFLRTESTYIGHQSLSCSLYERYKNIDKFIQSYSVQQFTNVDLVEMMTEETLVSKMHAEMQGKILSKIIKGEKFSQTTPGKKSKLEKIKVSTDGGIKSLVEVASGGACIAEDVMDEISNNISKSEIGWFSEQTSIDISKLSQDYTEDAPQVAKTIKKEIKPHIAKWRSAEQQCIDIEKYFGNTATDVSKQNVGYDIESTTPDGCKRYIEVKSITEDGSFSITNNEYTAAHQYGEQYYLCLLIQSAQNTQAIYIQNPLETLKFEKRIRQWEWYCDTYSGESFIFEN